MSDNFLEQMEEDSSTSQLDNVSTEGLRSIAEIARAIKQTEAGLL